MFQNRKIRVILADDHTIVRDGIRSLLKNDDEIEMVGEAAHGEELLTLMERLPADLILLDINMPVMDGYEAARQIMQRFPETKMLAISMVVKEQLVQKIMAIGVKGYLFKDSSREELRVAIKLVANGQQYMCSHLALKLLERKIDWEVKEDGLATNDNLLSGREKEVLDLIAEGYTNTQIAEMLFTSKRTVEAHRQNMLDKTNARNTASLVKWAYQNGYISNLN